ncbi:MAG: hypothetical protein EP338_07210 [Bacteroidetes bacterium]|nr:MAG: hypothetical protein EP338_07210 [Bacteroidota bacterium]
MGKDIMDQVFAKSYHELTEAEKMEMKDLFTSEEEFLQIKMVMDSLEQSVKEQEASLASKAETKERLDHLFHETYQSRGILWYNSVGSFLVTSDKRWYQQNLTRIAAVLLVALFSLPLLMNNWEQKNNNLVAHHEPEKTVSPKLVNPESTEQKKLAAVTAREKKLEEANGEPPVLAFDYEDKEIAGDIDLRSEADKDRDLLAPAREHRANGTGFILADSVATTMTTDASFSNHPDGVFVGNDQEVFAETAVSAAPGKKQVLKVKENPYLLDLLTATY